MDKRVSISLWCALLLVPASAGAYVGPGAGLSLLGALWALLVALATALAFVIAWPVRRMLRRRREQQGEVARAQGQKNTDEKHARPTPERREETRRPPHAPEPRRDEEALPSKRQ